MRTGLVLTGGGARSAYQAGVIRGIAELLSDAKWPFQVIAGLSAGAINGAFLASQRGGLGRTAGRLWEMWDGLEPRDIFRTDRRSLLGIGARWLADLSLGGLLGSSRSTYLLDTTPLRALLARELDPDALRQNLDSGRLHAFGVTATSYLTGTALTFFDGAKSLQPWQRNTRAGVRRRVGVDHVLASAAIPLFFPPVNIGGVFFGDGGLRLDAPLSPAIHLGSDRVVAIGLHYSRPLDETRRLNRDGHMTEISAVDVAGIALNAVFLRTLEADVERLQRINRTLHLLRSRRRRSSPLRAIPILVLSPSQDLGQLASERFRNFPFALQYLLRGIGASPVKGWDLLSYLAFDKAYTGALLRLGYADVLRRKAEVVAFFNA